MRLWRTIYEVFDVLGREVVTLVNEEKPAGRYSVNWDASRMASGVYIYRIDAGKSHSAKTMILLQYITEVTQNKNYVIPERFYRESICGN